MAAPLNKCRARNSASSCLIKDTQHNVKRRSIGFLKNQPRFCRVIILARPILSRHMVSPISLALFFLSLSFVLFLHLTLFPYLCTYSALISLSLNVTFKRDILASWKERRQYDSKYNVNVIKINENGTLNILSKFICWNQSWSPV